MSTGRDNMGLAPSRLSRTNIEADNPSEHDDNQCEVQIENGMRLSRCTFGVYGDNFNPDGCSAGDIKEYARMVGISTDATAKADSAEAEAEAKEVAVGKATQKASRAQKSIETCPKPWMYKSESECFGSDGALTDSGKICRWICGQWFRLLSASDNEHRSN